MALILLLASLLGWASRVAWRAGKVIFADALLGQIVAAFYRLRASFVRVRYLGRLKQSIKGRGCPALLIAVGVTVNATKRPPWFLIGVLRYDVA